MASNRIDGNKIEDVIFHPFFAGTQGKDMVFSSNIFLFLYLPVLLGAYYLCPRRLRNSWLLAGSLVFYAWGETYHTLLLCASVLMNYGFGAWVHRVRDRACAPWVATACVILNLLPLVYFKYATFFCDIIAAGLLPLGVVWTPDVHVTMPIGISFFTFQALSYVLDVYRSDTPPARSPIDVALYIAFFPQLIAGPIVRYRDVAEQLDGRRESVSQFAEGVERFAVGLAKKVLLANSLGAIADQIFAIPNGELTTTTAWLGAVSYTLQIYFDFSGYSDMAIGLGLMFGIRFLENFRYPYVSRSVTEFWRRWHISLSVWFRDYVYIPLGGNRRGPWRVYGNLLIVFVLCGLWHGASWSFVIWGLFHGCFLIIERIGVGRLLERCPAAVAHLYTLSAVMGGWVLFRANDLQHAGDLYRTLLGFGRAESLEFHLGMYLDRGAMAVLVAGIVGAMPWVPLVQQRLNDRRRVQPSNVGLNWFPETVLGVGRLAALGGLILAVAVMLSASTYNPFIYFRF